MKGPQRKNYACKANYTTRGICNLSGTKRINSVLIGVKAASDGDIRVIDESGEDYLYPVSFFVVIEVPQEVERAILRAS